MNFSEGFWVILWLLAVFSAQGMLIATVNKRAVFLLSFLLFSDYENAMFLSQVEASYRLKGK